MPLSEQKEKEILEKAQERLAWAIEEDSENRKMAMEDLRFVYVKGAQWPEKIKTERENDGRPCLEINKMPTFVDQVVGDQRQNRPSIKVIPVDSKSDPGLAEILGGWIKNVQQVSKADIAVDHGFEHAVACGYGAMRVITEYESDESFNQDARIQKIDNALAVWWGPHSEYDCSDAPWCFIVDDMPREEYKNLHGEKAEPVSFSHADSSYVEGWSTRDTVRVAEYFVKEPTHKTIYLLNDGSVVDQKPDDENTIVNKRKAIGYKIKWYLLTGNAVLDEKQWVGKKYIPVIPIWGKEINVGNRRYVRGLIRMGIDSQRMYNYWSSLDTEMVALSPKAPYLATPKQLEGHESQWKEAHKKNFPYLLINPDPKAPGWPKREAPPQVSTALTERIVTVDQEMRDTVGLQKASLGMQSNERSGKAIMERKKEGDVGTFAFIDNLARSIEHLGRVLIDVAPGILDTERIIRLGLEDGLQKFEAVNVADPENPGKILNDLSIGKYDIVVTVGPSYSTQRTEARDSMNQFVQYVPQAGPLIGDKLAKLMDWPGADEVAQRLRYLLPPEIRAQEEAKEAEQKGQPIPQPAQAPPPPPDPVLEGKIAEQAANLKILDIKTAQEAAKLEGIQLDNQIKQASHKMDIHDRIVGEEERSAGTQS